MNFYLVNRCASSRGTHYAWLKSWCDLAEHFHWFEVVKLINIYESSETSQAVDINLYRLISVSFDISTG